MNLAALPNWAIGLLIFILFGVLPAVSHLLGPDETDSLKAVADIDASLASMYAAANNQPAAQVAAKE